MIYFKPSIAERITIKEYIVNVENKREIKLLKKQEEFPWRIFYR